MTSNSVLNDMRKLKKDFLRYISDQILLYQDLFVTLAPC